jgi:glucoside 3-dehydrogenase (cytochrome c) catalytic subunit
VNSRRYDVIIVGTGAAGGLAAHQLATAGLDVLSLEYGPPVSDGDLMSFEQYWQAFQRMPYLELEKATTEPGPLSWKRSKYFIYKDDVDYKTSGDAPWFWRRYRCVGGRSVFWNGVSPRFSPHDFRAGSEDGFGPDWPLAYADLEPYYDRVEELIGVEGPQDLNHPEWPRGKFMKPQPFRCGEMILHRTVKKLNMPDLIYSNEPKAIITQPHNGRPPCHYCGECAEGCAVGAKYNSAQVLLPEAKASGHWTLQSNAVAAEIIADPQSGLARGVRWVDRITKKAAESYARVVMVCASTIETARLLLNSKSRQYPNGIANNNGHVGKHLKDHIQCSIRGFLPQLKGRKPYPDEGYTWGGYIPRFNRSYQKSLGYIRGFQTQSGSGKGIDTEVRGFGAGLKRGVTERYEAFVGATSFGERLDNPQTYVEIDPSGEKDQYGIPIVNIHAELWGDNEQKMFKDMQEKLRMIFEAAGAEDIVVSAHPPHPGNSEHETGVCRMGNDPKEFVTNQFGQTHEVKNLFISDCSLFPQQPEKSPTLTLLALTMRNCDHLKDELKRRNVG